MTQQIEIFDTINALSLKHGFKSSGRFLRHLKGLSELKKVTVRELRIGTRTKLHSLDVERVLSPGWII